MKSSHSFKFGLYLMRLEFSSSSGSASAPSGLSPSIFLGFFFLSLDAEGFRISSLTLTRAEMLSGHSSP